MASQTQARCPAGSACIRVKTSTSLGSLNKLGPRGSIYAGPVASYVDKPLIDEDKIAYIFQVR